MDCLAYLLRVEQIELRRRRRCKLMAALSQQWDGHPPENSRGPCEQDVHAAHVNDTAHGRVGRGKDSRCFSTRIKQAITGRGVQHAKQVLRIACDVVVAFDGVSTQVIGPVGEALTLRLRSSQDRKKRT
jgi:hypothetical protein